MNELDAARLVRVTIEADAVPVQGGFLRINVGPSTAVIDPNAANVKVEDIEPQYDWRDGDVIVGGGRNESTYCRKGGSWLSIDTGFIYDDARMTLAVRAGATVLRYRAGEDQ